MKTSAPANLLGVCWMEYLQQHLRISCPFFEVWFLRIQAVLDEETAPVFGLVISMFTYSRRNLCHLRFIDGWQPGFRSCVCAGPNARTPQGYPPDSSTCLQLLVDSFGGRES